MTTTTSRVLIVSVPLRVNMDVLLYYFGTQKVHHCLGMASTNYKDCVKGLYRVDPVLGRLHSRAKLFSDQEVAINLSVREEVLGRTGEEHLDTWIGSVTGKLDAELEEEYADRRKEIRRLFQEVLDEAIAYCKTTYGYEYPVKNIASDEAH